MNIHYSLPMTILALSDLHLSTPMERYNPVWKDHAQKIESHWRSLVTPNDLVLVAGDITSALKMKDALPDLLWLDALPGTKLLLEGNHDHWWPSPSKMSAFFPPSLKALHNNSYLFGDVAIAGSRMWENPLISFPWYKLSPPPDGKTFRERDKEKDQKIFQRELLRLETSLRSLPLANHRIAMLHYPPTSPDQEDTPITTLLEQYQIHTCIYGHLHGLPPSAPVNFRKKQTSYICTSADYLNFCPIKLL